MRTLTSIVATIVIILFVTTFDVGAQSAAPNRITFAKGKTSATVSETLSGDQEYDMVFGAKKGQTITMSVRSDGGPNLFDFTFMGDGFDVPSDEPSYTMYSITATETGDYLVTVRKNPKVAVRTARFYFTLTIR
ncbi:MAG TPA: hypothetical protein PKM58_08170 [Pyrinomonadaceae bacterium]|nr:hypothetical protein [Pyrinomonadaceae bacterium]HNU09587.1 hypothetical protein [Pyrinomonadaceae bacterium]